MKNRISLLLAIVCLWSFFACARSEEDIPLPAVSFTENIEVGFESLNLTCTVNGNVTAEKILMQYSTDSSMGQTTKADLVKGDGDTFILALAGLKSKTTYYYRYTLINKLGWYSDKSIRNFETTEYEEPAFSALRISDVQPNSARLTVTLNKEGSLPVTERGFCYSYYDSPPTVYGSKVTVSSSNNSYSGTLSSLRPSTKYYVRAYAKNAKGTYYSSQKDFTTTAGSITLGTPTISNIQPQSATATVTIESTGGSTVTERGFCYSTSANPTVSDKRVIVSSSNNTFSVTLSSLTPSTKYYVRAYAMNSSGTYYSAQEVFTTSSSDIVFGAPVISNIQPQLATATATIKDAGASTITERGFCYATTANPTVSHNKVTVSSSSNTYSGTLSSLSPSTRYYVRAYAKNSSGTYYSVQEVFTTADEGKYVSFEDQEFRKYCLQNFDKNGDGQISYSEAEKITKIDVGYYSSQGHGQIQSLVGVEHFSQLIELYCDNNQITEINLGNLQKLQKFHCNDNELASLDVSLLTELKVLECGNARYGYGNNHLSSLDVSKNLQLENLFCNGNQLTELSLSNNTKLKFLSCSNNKLSSLNIETLVDLEDLRCENFIINGVDYNGSNRLSTLDISNNRKLLRLYLGGGVCHFTTINLSNNVLLKSLSISGGYLTNLNLSSNTLLEELDIEYNRFTEIDIRNNILLKRLSCYYNQLTTLDISKNTQLEYLYCQNNQLTSLDVSGNVSLKWLKCRGNPKLTTVWLSYNQSIQNFDYDSFTTIRYK